MNKEANITDKMKLQIMLFIREYNKRKKKKQQMEQTESSLKDR